VLDYGEWPWMQWTGLYLWEKSNKRTLCEMQQRQKGQEARVGEVPKRLRCLQDCLALTCAFTRLAVIDEAQA